MNRLHEWEVWILLTCIQIAFGYYHTPSRKYITYSNLTADSHFGYSISYQSSTKRLIVGAPKANVIGEVFAVDIDSFNVTQLETPQILMDHFNDIESKFESQKNFLYGATVTAGPNSIITCAPKHIQKKTINKKTKMMSLGLCFNNLLDGKISLLDDEKVFPGQISKPYGWSVVITKSNGVAIGTPAFYTGQVKVIRNNEVVQVNPSQVHYSFGYSLAVGNYFDAIHKTSEYFAVSTPYAIIGNGKILFYNAKNLKEPKVIIYNYHLGSLFGASLCTVNLGERQDYILVGAPCYSEDNVDGGAVHLYTFKDMQTTLHKTIVGPSKTSVYFGFSMANLGDIDGDMKDEVAIGSPYEDNGRGAVYIYSGARLLDPNKNDNEMWIQRIQPEPNSKIISFGSSLTFLNDFDDNGCNELAVGSSFSNRVDVYKCFSYITVKLQPDFASKIEIQENKDNDKFTFKSCIDVIFPKKPENINETIRIQVKVLHPDIWFWTASGTDKKTNFMTYYVTIARPSERYCNQVEIATRKTGNFEQLMSYDITASLINDPRNDTEFDSNRVLLSDQSVLSLPGSESLADCKSSTCAPKLNMELRSNMTTGYIVGSTSEVSFSFVINNAGDTAYTACLEVDIKGAPLVGLPQGCTTMDRRTITCTPTRLLKKNVIWETGSVVLDTRVLTSKDKEITLSYKLYNRCNNRTDYVDAHTELYSLENDINGIGIEKKSEPGNVVVIFSDTLQVRHIYTITNTGPTTWTGVNISVVLMNIKGVTKYGNIILETEDDRADSCQILESETEDTVNAYCKYIDLKSNSKVNVIIPFMVTPSEYNTTMETLNVSTSLEINLDNEIKRESAVTQLRFNKSTVPLWIIVTASVFALLLLILLGYALSSFGFLKRKKKGELQDLKRSVYRQSVQRRSMRHSKRPDGENTEDGSTEQNTSQDDEILFKKID